MAVRIAHSGGTRDSVDSLASGWRRPCGHSWAMDGDMELFKCLLPRDRCAKVLPQ